MVIASTTIASTVEARTPIRIAPLTRFATRMPVTSRPTTNTSVGHDAIEPSMPSPTGTVVFASSGTRRTNPASTRPIRQMNRPIPTAMADLSGAGTALNTAVRIPAKTSRTMTRPSITTRPIASGQLICEAKVTAIRLLMPSPVAMANG
ncbi:hypothetical protein GCM10027598_15700 [Amycolatopsis oliviviridis]